MHTASAIRRICALLFVAFTFTFLYCYQADLLAYLQHTLSEGRTHYDPLWGAVIITALLLLVQQLVAAKCGSMQESAYALTYMPSLYLLATLTGFDVEGGRPAMHWWIPTVLAVLIWTVTAAVLHQLYPYRKRSIKHTFSFATLWNNLLVMALMMLCTGLAANGDNLLHTRLRIERLMAEGDTARAADKARQAHTTDTGLHMVRALALAKNGELGEHLFEQQFHGGSATILPYPPEGRTWLLPQADVWRTLGCVPSPKLTPMRNIRYAATRQHATRAAKDYYLCALLADRRLDDFAAALTQLRDTAQPLPKHYKEALTLRRAQRHAAPSDDIDPAMEADHSEFAARAKQKTPDARRKLKDTYGTTYWYYYLEIKN